MLPFASAAEDSAAPLTELDRAHSSGFILLAVVALAVLVYGLYYFGVIGSVVGFASSVVRAGIRRGFSLWEKYLSFATWPAFLAIVLALTGAGILLPSLAIVCGMAVLSMGIIACLAYMSIDIERYEVSRGYKAVHDPLKGQELALHLIRYGDRLGVPLLGVAALAAIGGFALLNKGLYESIGQAWFSIGDEKETPGYTDFLAYTLINLYRVVDLLDLSGSHNLLRFRYVRQAAWPATALLTAFKTFFTLVLLQQIFASIRLGYALAESIADFWSPHPPIHERALSSLPQHGVGVVRPLLTSLRTVSTLTKEQRDQLPQVIAGIGPSAIPTLIEHLTDPHEGVRSVAAASLGLLHSLDALPALAALREDSSELVRQAAVGALGVIGGLGIPSADKRSRVPVRPKIQSRIRWIFRRKGPSSFAHQTDRVELAVSALRAALSDDVVAVRVTAARALGQVGRPAAPAAADLSLLLKDADESARCQAAESLGLLGEESMVPALAGELSDPSPAVRAAAAKALATFNNAARPAVPALIPLLQDPDESVRLAAGDAIGRAGQLTEEATAQLVEGLNSADTLVRAQTAEALGTIGEGAAEAAPALAQALKTGNDRVRAKAAEALGKMGDVAAEVAVPELVRALKDRDNWVSALAAEALGEMGNAAEEAVPSLVRSLRHINPLVRANAAEAIGKMGNAAVPAIPDLIKISRDEDGGVRAQALRGLGEITPASEKLPGSVFEGLQDEEPRVRAAAAETLGKRGSLDSKTGEALLPLLEDSNDQVKYEVIRALAKLATPTAEVVEGLCRRLLEDDRAWICETAAQVLGPLGADAVAAGPALLRAARTGEAVVREQALRAISMIQPPETAEALIDGMRDASPDVRKIASAGWMKASTIPPAAIPVLIEALHDPEVQVRANAAHALARLESIPPAAIPVLIECASDPNDGLRLNAVVALRGAGPDVASDTLHHLFEDPSSRIRLIAAGAILARDPDDVAAAEVVTRSLADPAFRLREGAFDAIAALGDRASAFLDVLRKRAWEEEELELRERVNELLARLESLQTEPIELEIAAILREDAQ